MNPFHIPKPPCYLCNEGPQPKGQKGCLIRCVGTNLHEALKEAIDDFNRNGRNDDYQLPAILRPGTVGKEARATFRCAAVNQGDRFFHTWCSQGDKGKSFANKFYTFTKKQVMVPICRNLDHHMCQDCFRTMYSTDITKTSGELPRANVGTRAMASGVRASGARASG